MRPVSSPPLAVPRSESPDAYEPGPGQMPAVPISRRLVRWAVMGFLAAAAIAVTAPLWRRPPAANTIPLLRYLATFTAQSGPQLAGWVALSAAGVLALAGLVWSRTWLQWRRSRVRGAIARRLKPLRPDQIRVRARWSPIRRWLPDRIKVRYPSGMVQSDPTDELVEMFAVEFGLTVRASWAPRRDGIDIQRIAPPRPTGPDPTRLEDDNVAVGKLHTTLAPLLPGLTVDQTQTRLDDNGAPQLLVLNYEQTTKDIAPRFRARVQSVIESKVPSPTGAWAIRWRPEDHTVVVSPSEPLPEFALNEGLPPEHTDMLALPLGFGSGNRLRLWRPLKYPHLLISGATGGGKTALIRTVLVMALLSGWRVWILDPKQTSFQHFADWPGVERLCITGEEMRQAALDHRDEMQKIYRDLLLGRVTHDQITPILLIFDEVTEGFADIGEYVEENFEDIQDGDKNIKLSRELKRAESAIWRVTRKGREARAWQLLGLQRPDTRFIPGEARDNLISRAAAGQMRGDGLEMMFEDPSVKQRVTKRIEDPETGEIREQQVPGRITVDLGDGPEPMQSLWTPDPAKATEDERALLERLREQVADAQIARMRREKFAEVARAGEDDDEPVSPTKGVDRSSDTHPSLGEQVPAGDLEAGQWILLEVGGETIAVEVLELTADDDDETVTVEYCTVEGEAGGYELEAAELVTVTPGPDQELSE